MSFLKKHAGWILAFGYVYLYFLHPLITMQKGFTLGDYELQFYPWTRAFAEALRGGHLLLWTPLIQCGFPLFAEGQTAMLYLPNLVLFGALPFEVAYNAMFLSHFLAGGIFAYAFARKRGLSSTASAIFSLAFTFGSAYAGCFYNIVSMRTLVWFPALLWLIEHGLGTKKPWVGWVYAVVLSQALLGGFPQTAVYGAGFAFIYFFLRHKPLGGTFSQGFYFLAANLLAFFIASPQIWASLELAAHSTRAGQHGAELALWGSAEPWTFATLFMASWGGFVASGLYIGLAPFLLLFYRVPRIPRDAWVLLVLSIFLALGKYNPLWHLLLSLPVMSMLRNPSKFLFFTAFFLVFLAAGGYDSLVADLEGRITTVSRYVRRTAIACVILLLVALATAALVRVFEPAILEWGHDYVEKNIFGRAHHRLSMAEYDLKLRGIFSTIRSRVNPAYPLFWMPFGLAALFLARIKLFGRGSRANFHASVLAILCLDLVLFGRFHMGSGFVGNTGPFPDVERYARLPKDGRIVEFVTGSEEMLPPNQNMLYGIPVAGAYSPLVDKSYTEYTRRLGAVDDSFGRGKPDPMVYLTDDPLLDDLSVKYVLSDRKELRPALRLVGALNGRFLFVNTAASPEAYLKLPGMPRLRVLPTRGASTAGTDASQRYTFTALAEGDFVRTVTYDPGWRATVDGYATPIDRYGEVFQSVPIEQTGQHTVTFRYAPNWFIIGFWFYAGGLLFALAGLVHALLGRK